MAPWGCCPRYAPAAALAVALEHCRRQLAPSSGTLIANIRILSALRLRFGCPADLGSCPSALSFHNTVMFSAVIDVSATMCLISLIVQLQQDTAGCHSEDLPLQAHLTQAAALLTVPRLGTLSLFANAHNRENLKHHYISLYIIT